MNDFDFLDWVADRLVYKFGDPPNVDFILRLRRMASPTADWDELIHGESFIGPGGRRINPAHVSTNDLIVEMEHRGFVGRFFGRFRQ